jgi:hypothetical protein
MQDPDFGRGPWPPELMWWITFDEPQHRAPIRHQASKGRGRSAWGRPKYGELPQLALRRDGQDDGRVSSDSISVSQAQAARASNRRR